MEFRAIWADLEEFQVMQEENSGDSGEFERNSGKFKGVLQESGKFDAKFEVSSD